MGLDLGGHGVKRESQRRDEILAQAGPIDVWVRDEVGVVVTDSAIHFAVNGAVLKIVKANFHAGNKVCQFFADRCR